MSKNAQSRKAAATIDAAMTYIDDWGFSVIPIHPDTKVPAIKWKEFQQRRATAEEVTEWFTRWPGEEGMLAVVTGAISGIYVVDADSDDAIKAAHELELASPVIVSTKRGRHFYFTHPGDDVLRGPQSGTNSKGIVWPRIPGLDFRGDGGYALLPPSPNYQWIEDDLSLAPKYPDWHGERKQPELPPVGTEFDLLGLDLSATRQRAQSTWELVAEQAAKFSGGKIPRNGSGIYDATFNYLAEAVLEYGLGEALEEAGRIFMRTFYESELEPARYQQNLITIRQKERENHPERFDINGNYIGHHKAKPAVAEVDLGSHTDDHPPREVVSGLPSDRPLTFSDDDIEMLEADSDGEQFIQSPWLRHPSIIQIAGYSGHGKSMWLQHMLYHAVAGLHVGPFRARAKDARVLYLDFENGRRTVVSRLREMVDSFGPTHQRFNTWAPFWRKEDMNLRTAEGLHKLKELITYARPDVLVIDTIRSAFPGLEENSADAWSEVNQLCLKLRNHGITVILVHHTNKPDEKGRSREAGSSNQLTVLETQIKITQVYQDQTTSQAKGGLCSSNLPENPWTELKKKCPPNGSLQVVMEMVYGKVRDMTPEHEQTQYFGFGSTDDKRFIVSSMSPMEKAMMMHQAGRSNAEIAEQLGRPQKVVRGWAERNW
ncbi:bifunctional DNA primase/polymerase [Microbulbifer agarilyticus]|uniref:bifunctional DNA primase/polymerase n=1 Tax=Microbulbifer agarilyticus TaxID=260552 RepID=UPI001C94E2E8|nr:bifunctional DNA primase/polymerase [Microbulbifer agarilyticus]MBY6212361.1 bifunctional DNA primase/polymerase [Microbulbifer agarilyticus]